MSIFLPGGHACRGSSRFQRDKTGRPCIEHCRRVADAVDTIDQRRLPTFTTLSKKAKAEPPSSKRRLGQKIASAVDAMSGQARSISLSPALRGAHWRSPSNAPIWRITSGRRGRSERRQPNTKRAFAYLMKSSPNHDRRLPAAVLGSASALPPFFVSISPPIGLAVRTACSCFHLLSGNVGWPRRFLHSVQERVFARDVRILDRQ